MCSVPRIGCSCAFPGPQIREAVSVVLQNAIRHQDLAIAQKLCAALKAPAKEQAAVPGPIRYGNVQCPS